MGQNWWVIEGVNPLNPNCSQGKSENFLSLSPIPDSQVWLRPWFHYTEQENLGTFFSIYARLSSIWSMAYAAIASVRNFGCPCARDNQKSRRATKNTDAVVRRTTINFDAPAVKLILSHYCLPCSMYGQPKAWTDNQKL